jgi:hypothetical protein
MNAQIVWPVKCILDDPVNEFSSEPKLQVSFHCDDVSDRRLIVGRGCVMMRSRCALSSSNLEEMRYIATYMAARILDP